MPASRPPNSTQPRPSMVSPIGLAVIGAGYWGPNLVRTALATPALQLEWMCDHTYCYTPAVRRIRDLIRGGEIGEVQFVDSVRINLGLVQPDIDVLWDLAPHDLSILDFVLPEEVKPLAVAAHTVDPIGNGY